MSWGGLYGGAWGTSGQSLAREDTRLLLLGDTVTDESQYATDLTATGAAGYELTSARAALTGETGREIYARCTMAASEADTIWAASASTDGLTAAWAIGTDNLGRLYCRAGGSAIWTGATSPAGDLSFSWSTRANPDTTGASDALLSEVVIYDHTAGDWVTIEQFTHAVQSAPGGYTLTVGGVWVSGGTGLVRAPSTPVTKARVSNAWHPSTEVAEDWIVERAQHTHVYDRVTEPLGAGAELGNQGAWAGQANVGFAAAHANGLRGRMLSPIIRETYPEAPTLSSATWTDTATRNRWMPGPGGATVRLDCTKLRKLNVKGVRYAHVRVQVQSYVTSGSAVPVELRCYAMNRPHIGLGLNLDGHPMPGLKYAFVSSILSIDHGSGGVGQWLDLGALKLPAMDEPIPGWVDTVTLVLGYEIDPAAASANDANARLIIKAWQVLPLVGEP
jgi:hypothetical protein